MLSNHPHTAVFLGSAIKNNAQPNKAEHYLSVCAQLYRPTLKRLTFKSQTRQGRRVNSHPPDGVDLCQLIRDLLIMT